MAIRRKDFNFAPIREELRQPSPLSRPRMEESVRGTEAESKVSQIKPSSMPGMSLPRPMAISFADDTTLITQGMWIQMDEIAKSLLAALDVNPALSIRISSFGEEPHTSAAAWRQSRDRMDSVACALEQRGVPRALLELHLAVEDAPEFAVHARSHVLIQVSPRFVAGSGR